MTNFGRESLRARKKTCSSFMCDISYSSLSSPRDTKVVTLVEDELVTTSRISEPCTEVLLRDEDTVSKELIKLED